VLGSTAPPTSTSVSRPGGRTPLPVALPGVAAMPTSVLPVGTPIGAPMGTGQVPRVLPLPAPRHITGSDISALGSGPGLAPYPDDDGAPDDLELELDGPPVSTAMFNGDPSALAPQIDLEELTRQRRRRTVRLLTYAVLATAALTAVVAIIIGAQSGMSTTTAPAPLAPPVTEAVTPPAPVEAKPVEPVPAPVAAPVEPAPVEAAPAPAPAAAVAPIEPPRAAPPRRAKPAAPKRKPAPRGWNPDSALPPP
jgi:hypothetical protein